MFGYILSILLLIYFFGIWPRFDNLPPRSARTRRQRLAGTYGLHDVPSVGKIELSQNQKDELMNYISFTDGQTFANISNSKHFYLVESRKSKLSLYCSLEEPNVTVDYFTLQSRNFIRINIEEHLLVRFLNELKLMRRV